MFTGGEGKEKAFEALAKAKGMDVLDRSKLDAMSLLMSPDWHRISEAMDKGGIKGPLSPTGNAVLAGMFDPSRNLSANENAVRTLIDYAGALQKRGVPEGDILSQERLLTDRMQTTPNIVLTVNVDKSGNVSLVNQSTGKVLNSVGIRQ